MLFNGSCWQTAGKNGKHYINSEETYCAAYQASTGSYCSFEGLTRFYGQTGYS